LLRKGAERVKGRATWSTDNESANCCGRGRSGEWMLFVLVTIRQYDKMDGLSCTAYIRTLVILSLAASSKSFHFHLTLATWWCVLIYKNNSNPYPYFPHQIRPYKSHGPVKIYPREERFASITSKWSLRVM